MSPVAELDVVELTERTWPALTGLFGPNGASSGCWCLWFLLSPNEIRANGTDVNRELLHDRVRAGEHLGLLALEGERAVGWVAVGPRAGAPRLDRATITAPVGDPAGVWSITCFFVHRTARRRGVTATLLAEAVRHAGRHRARAIEGYPVDPAGAKVSSGSLYHGTLGMFEDAGFAVIRSGERGRSLVRLELAAG